MTCQDVVRDELAERYVGGQLAEAQQEAFEQHFFQCPRCTEDVRLLQDLQTALAHGATRALRTPRRAAIAGPATWRWLAVAATFVLVATLGWRVWRTPPASPSPPGPVLLPRGSPPVGAPGLVALIQLNDAGGTIQVDATGQLSAATQFDPADAASVKDALLTKRITPAAVLRQLISLPGQLLGAPAQSSDLQPLAPVGTVVLGDRPAFRWRSVPGAAGYVVSIYDGGFHKVAESPRVDGDRWDADRRLLRDVTYTWQISAVLRGTVIRAPVPPAPEARFHVLSQGEMEHLDMTRQAHADSHALLGILYARAGALDDAERELTALLAANPESTVARDLLASVQRLRRGRAD
jgi:anti-sigma factor RsiW